MTVSAQEVFNTCVIFMTFIVAEFAFEQATYFVNEQDGGILLCVTFLSIELDRDIDLEVVLAANSQTGDFNTSRLPYRFLPGTRLGEAECNLLGVTQDGIVERVETFTVLLQDIVQENDVNIAQENAQISIEDSLLDCEFVV